MVDELDFGAVRSALASGGRVPWGWREDERALRYVRDMTQESTDWSMVGGVRFGAQVRPQAPRWSELWQGATWLGVALKHRRRRVVLPLLRGDALESWRERQVLAQVERVVALYWEPWAETEPHVLELLVAYRRWCAGAVFPEQLLEQVKVAVTRCAGARAQRVQGAGPAFQTAQAALLLGAYVETRDAVWPDVLFHVCSAHAEASQEEARRVMSVPDAERPGDPTEQARREAQRFFDVLGKLKRDMQRDAEAQLLRHVFPDDDS